MRANVPSDVAARNKIEQALSDSEAKATAILDTAVDGIITIDERGIVESVNHAAERLFGYPASEVIGRNVSMLMPEPYSGEHDQYLANYRATGRARIIGIGREVVGRRRDGSVFPLDLAVSEVCLRDRRLFTGIVRDLSDRKRLEQEVLAIGDRERRRIGQDLHDGLGQLLAAIAFKTRLLQKKFPEDTPENAVSISNEIIALTSQAMIQARAIAHGLQPVEPRPLGLVAALHALATSTSELFRITCEFECPRPLAVKDPTAATHLYRIAQEAVNNAVKHGKASRLQVSLKQDGPNAVLEISDDGVGFPTNAPPSGGGMGLRTMKYRAALIGGSVSVLPNPERGTRVICTMRSAGD